MDTLSIRRRMLAGAKRSGTDYSQQYLTFEVTAGGTFGIANASPGNPVYYSLDGGVSWNEPSIHGDAVANAGDTILWKSNDNAAQSTTTYRYFTASTGAKCKVSGNIMSLIYGNNFVGQTALINAYQFFCLFDSFSAVTDASNLVLSATTLTANCYRSLFYGCSNLIAAPRLPAMTLADSCYYGMFNYCSSLTEAPELPATTLAASCYCYMFYSCTNLTSAPALPATTLAGSCYNAMFRNCNSLTSAPALPATTLATGCYAHMFRNCYYLTSAPELPATALVSQCYNYMFHGCNSLGYIKALFTTTPSTSYTSNWVGNVAASGIFVKSSSASWNVRGNHGVPSGWTIQTA